uniref:Uncharacterized protein n=1 Tax=Ulva partita TaxID=1605170 RepID=A0A1C9ZPQ6_9CHLO|nr:hypothetical protein [Ulva partita]
MDDTICRLWLKTGTCTASTPDKGKKATLLTSHETDSIHIFTCSSSRTWRGAGVELITDQNRQPRSK